MKLSAPPPSHLCLSLIVAGPCGCGDDPVGAAEVGHATSAASTDAPDTAADPPPTTAPDEPGLTETGGDGSGGAADSATTTGTTTGPPACEARCPTVCVDGLGCVACVPGEHQCTEDGVETCKQDGSGFDPGERCDALQGLECDAELGACVGACAVDALGASYLGCDYYPTVTQNDLPFDGFTFAVAIASASDTDADITITRGDATIAELIVPAGELEIVPLPWIDDLLFTGAAYVYPDAAYRVRSTRPVTVYQYNPLEYIKADGKFSYTNDASLLLPAHAWGDDIIVVTRNTHEYLAPGSYVVVAREDATTVTLYPSATGGLVLPGPALGADGAGVVMLDAGDVLQVLSDTADTPPVAPDFSDLTGTRVIADKPVQVIGSHMCTFVPHDVPACDHLEETNLPTASLGSDYLVTAPLIEPENAAPFAKGRMIRIVATAPNTAVAYDPPQEEGPTWIAEVGDYIDFMSDDDVRITASAKVAVAEYMLGQLAGGGMGDPSMTIAIPIGQYLDHYVFHAPDTYDVNYVNLTAPLGTAIVLDGEPVGALTPIGATDFGVLRVRLAEGGDHTLAGDQPFGVQVYGYGQFTSYWHPGGLALATTP